MSSDFRRANSSFKHALVVGASGGIGSALVKVLAETRLANRITGWSRSPCGDLPLDAHATVDVTDPLSIATATSQLGEVDLVIVATGLLHRSDPTPVMPEKTFRALDAAVMAQSFAINTIGPALVAQQTLGLLPRGRRAVFAALSARVGSISDNRLGGWYSYRASKAALNQIIRTLSIELGRTHPLAVCVGLHPGTVSTGLSAPFQSAVQPAKLFTQNDAAARLLGVIDQLRPEQSGRVWDWAGNLIPD